MARGIADWEVSYIDEDGNYVGGLISPKITTYSSDGAISLSDDIAELNGSSFSCQMTLADPVISGKRIIIICFENIGGVVDVDASFYTGDSTATFTIGDSLELISVKSGVNGTYYWAVIGNQGAVLS